MAENDFSKLESHIGYHFRDSGLIEEALTHPSYAGEHHVRHYQRLEFLGDAVLELTISRILFTQFSKLPEGQLTRIRAELVREESVSDIARTLGISGFIRMSAGEERSGGRTRASILCDVMEAVIAAVYLDGGFDAAFSMISRLWDGRINEDLLIEDLDAKTRLQELLQKDGGASPTYRLISQEGPSHKPVFTVSVMSGGKELAQAEGPSKREAQQRAARKALEMLAHE